MTTYKIALILSDGLVFGVLALGVLVSFRWLRFPDLTPDGSFAAGAVAYAIGLRMGFPPEASMLLGVAFGAVCGATTASVHEFARVPTVVAGLLVATALYSINWLLLGKPNEFIHASHTLVRQPLGELAAWLLTGYLTVVAMVVAFGLWGFGRSLLGLKLRAIGENPNLAKDVRSSRVAYTFAGLGIANGLVGLSGALFAQRSYSADVNMGIGITIAGLAAMVLGLVVVRRNGTLLGLIACTVAGGLAYRLISFLALEAGLKPEAYRLVSAAILIAVYVVIRAARMDLLKGLRWTWRHATCN